MNEQNLSHSIFGQTEEDTGATRRSRREARARAPRRRGPLGCLLVGLVVLAVIAAAFLSVGQLKPLVKGLVGGPEDYAASDVSATKATVTIEPSQQASAIGAALEKAGVVKSSAAFVAAAKANPDWVKLQPGTYELAQHQPAQDAVAWLVDPKHKAGQLVTVPEGLRKWEVYALLAAKTSHPVADYEAAEQQATTLGLPAAAKGDVEGWLFPSSYDFTPKTTPAAQLKAMIAKAVEETSALGVPAERIEDTVILASMVQAEGRRPEDLPKIARVFDNRIAQGMRLQSDATVVYPLKKRVLDTQPAWRNENNGYSTYAKKGLPKGPISNPGAAALEAAAHPADGPWTYFVVVDTVTGETKFASTLAEHNANVKQYQAFCKAHAGSC